MGRIEILVIIETLPHFVSLKRGNPSYKATFSLQKEWSYKRKTTVSNEQGKCIQVENKKLNSNAWQFNHNTLPPKT
jgi:hypothetical protein